jgi:NAD(P)-dependent dehydrogenase (short-subunit alcohol dehydrogenase family)
MSRLAGKVAVVTGAAGGLGAAVTRRLAQEGAFVALTDLDHERTSAAHCALTELGYECVSTAGDVADPVTIGALTKATVDAFGTVDILCNVAGISPPISIEDTTMAAFDTVMHTNCYAHLLAIQHVLPHMRAAGRGSIINVSSVGALVALPQLTAYSASKAAVLGLTRSIAYECATDNIRCNAICPGGIATPMATSVVDSFDDRDDALARLTGRQLFNRFADPEEVASMIAYLASDESSFVNGAVLSIDAGHTSW